MNNLVVFPLLIPLFTGILLFFFRKQINLQKWIAAAALLLTIGISGWLVHTVSTSGIQTLDMGNWAAPYGIVLVADMLAALLVLASSIVSLACLLYAFQSTDKDREAYYVYPFLLLLVCGVNGSFLTGDLFNLFVFFECMLLASYVLLSLGGGKVQLKESIKYVLVNVLSSSLFVIAIAYLYSVAGTLNMAHLSERIAAAGQDGILTIVSLLFLIVFGLKSALFLYFWLPGSYSAPPPAVSALFAALLTKVGIYSIVRVFTLVFYHSPEITHTVMLWMAGITMILGAIGAVAYWDVKKILAYNVIVAVGFIVFGISIYSSASLTGALYYLIHDMLAKALIFILGGAMISIAGTHKLKEITGLIRHHPMLGWLFFIGGLALAGIPPLSGFVGKVLVLQSGVEASQYVMVVIGLATSLLVLFSVIKIFLNGFWGETVLSEEEEHSTGKGVLIPGVVLTALVIWMGMNADAVLAYIDQAVQTLMNPGIYIEAVLRQN